MKGQPALFRVILRAYGEEHECELLPTGWAENSASWDLDVGSFGFNLKYSTKSLQFVKGDADFIRKQLDKYGISTEVDVIFQKRQNNWTYKDHFTAQMDFSTGYTNDRDFIQVRLNESGLKGSTSKDMRTRYDIGFDNKAVDLSVPEGITLYEQVKYSAVNTGGSSINSNNMQRHYLIMSIDTSNSFIESSNITFQKQSFISRINEDTGVITKIEEDIPFAKTEKAYSENNAFVYTNAKIKATITYKSDPIGKLDKNKDIIFYIEKTTILDDGTKSALSTPIKVIPAGYLLKNNQIEIDSEFTLSVSSVEKYEYRIYIEYYHIDSVFAILDFEGELNISFFGNASSVPFTLKAYKYSDFGNKLLNKVHPGATYKNSILDALEADDNMQLFITTSDAIRGLSDALIKTNLEDFEFSFYCLFSSGLKVSNTTNVYEICSKRDVFNPTNKLLDLGEVKELQIEQLPEDWIFNVFRYGYEKQEYDYPLGRQEFAATLEYSSALKVPTTKKKEAICKYRADYTGVHLIRYDYSNNEKKDSKSDNDIFVILAKSRVASREVTYSGISGTVARVYVDTGEQVTALQALFLINMPEGLQLTVYSSGNGIMTAVNVSVGDTITNYTVLGKQTITETIWEATNDGVTVGGLEGGGYFNILLSPHRNLRRNADYIHSILDKVSPVLTYVSGTETQSNIVSTYNGVSITEKTDEDTSSVTKLFRPMVVKCTAIVPDNLPELLGENPAGYFEFTWNKQRFKGFPFKIESLTAQKSAQQVSMVMHPDTPDDVQFKMFWRDPSKLY